MPHVVDASTAAGDAEGLAGAGSGPDGRVVGDAGEAEGAGPTADPGEEVDLSTHKVSCRESMDVSLHLPGCDVARRRQLA
jgi:hypothetical protein